MLAVSALRNPKNEREGEMEGLSMEEKEFPDFSGSNLLDSIDFDDLFLGMDTLPDLEMDPEEELMRVPSLHHQQLPLTHNHQSPHHKPTKPKNPHAKRKVKVDWTPELHRRFVQAVEQLGVDKAVPSRILELMGIDCLTRHNIASHLQKYRSHRKHLLAREAEAASWSQRRQLRPWAAAPTMGFPPVNLVRPLHVWGHPSVDQSIMPMPIWPKHLNPADPPSFWINSHHHVPTPCFPPHLQPPRFPSPAPVPGIPPAGMYKVAEQAGLGFPTLASRQTLPQPPSDIHPSKESVDAAIGDVLSKPWLPLPLGLKPPSVDGVMVELQRQGISNVPPSCA